MLKSPRHKTLLWILIVFGIIYGLISVVNHYCLRTFALDLGLYTNALYDYAHLQWNGSEMFKSVPENLLSDHFDLYLILLSPLTFIFGTYTLLIVQIGAILFGGMGVFKYFDRTQKQNFAIPATLFFLLFFGIFSSLSYDYHSNVVAACLLPWLFLSVKTGKLLQGSLIALAMIVAKENISLWMIFIFLALAFEHRKSNRQTRNWALGLSALSLIYFILIVGFIMPALSEKGAYPHFHYSALGSDGISFLKYIFTHPFEAIKILFTNHTGHEHGDYVKIELHVFLILTGLPLLIFKPHYLIMLVPIYAQKLYHDNLLMWGVGYQYAIEFAPIFAIGIFESIAGFKSIKRQQWTIGILLLCTLATTIRLMDNTYVPMERSRLRIYDAKHYSRHYDISKVKRLLRDLPADAIISAQSPFVPQLALRDQLYQFPIIKDAEFILLSDQESAYPLKPEKFFQVKDSLIAHPEWHVKFSDDNLLILQRTFTP